MIIAIIGISFFLGWVIGLILGYDDRFITYYRLEKMVEKAIAKEKLKEKK